MKYSSVLAAQIITYLMILALISVLVILLPELAREEAAQNPIAARTSYLFVMGAWVMAIPIFAALRQTLKLISFVANDEAISDRSVKALNIIKICAIVFGALVVIGATSVVTLSRASGQGEIDIPIPMFGFILTFVSSIIATSAAVLQNLVQKAIDIKSENDLTV